MEGDGVVINISTEDMEGMIQEWMAQAVNPVYLAKIYAAIIQETNRQLELLMASFQEDEE